MSLLYLTTFTLDIIGGAAIWTVTKTFNGVYYLLFGKTENKSITIDKELFQELIEDNKQYRDKIENLDNDIMQLTTYIKDIKNNNTLR